MDDERWRGLLPEVIREASGPVHHYTDAGGLIGLIEKQELWATEATGMNDLAEVRQGWDRIRIWVKKQYSDPVIEIIALACGEDDDDDDRRHPVRSEEGVFLCCASTRGDDANQWRLYGGRGYGYSVELRADESLVAIAREAAPPDASLAKSAASRAYITVGDSATVSPWLHVLYTDAEKQAALDGLAANARATWERRVRQGFSDEAEHDVAGQEFRDDLLTDVARIAHLIKTDGFAGENEVRVVVTAFFDSCSRFRATANGVVRYVPLTTRPRGHRADALLHLSSPPSCKGPCCAPEASSAAASAEHKALPVESVRLGPLINARSNERTIRALLNRNRLRGALVEASKVPLRG